MNRSYGFPAVCRVLSASGLIATLYIFIKLLHDQSDFIFPVLLMLCGLVICPLNIIFTKKERTIGIIVIFNAVIAAVFIAVTVISGCLNESFSLPYAIISFLLIIIFGTASVITTPKLTTSIVCFDAAALILALICLYVNANHFSYFYTLFSIIGSFAGLLGLIAYRNLGAYGKREWGLIIVLFLIIAFIAWILFTFVVSPLSSGIELAGTTVATAFTSLGAIINRFLKYLASLIKTDDSFSGTSGIETSSSSADMEEPGEESMGEFQGVIIAALFAAVIVIAVIFIVKHRKSKVNFEIKNASTDVLEQNNSALKDAVQIFINKIKRYFSARKFLKANKNRAEGVYFELVKIAKHSVFEKREGDTATEFLLRIKGLLELDGCDTLCFDDLIQRINNNFYGKIMDTTEFVSAKILKKNVKKSIKLYKTAK